MRRKGLVVGISLLFISISIVSSLTFDIAKASDENTLAEVTLQVCGIEGFGETRVKLTDQQYRNLQQYLINFRARLNQTTTKVEADSLFKEAVVELSKYDLLPKRMDVQQVQKLVTGGRYQQIPHNLWKKIFGIQNKHTMQSNNVINVLCYFYAHTKYALEDNIWVLIASFFGHLDYKYDLKIFSFLNLVFWEYSQFKPFRSMNDIIVPGPGIGGITYTYFTLGMLGIRKGSDDFGIAYGFSGIKLILDGQWEAVYFGFTIMAMR